MTKPAAAMDGELDDLIASCYDDPNRYVLAVWPWGERGPLERSEGPDAWQTCTSAEGARGERPGGR